MLKKIWTTYKNLSVVARASLWFMFCTMLQKCLAIITTPIFTRIMDQEQYGYFSTYLSVTTIFTVILTFNFDTCAYINGISKFKTETEKNELGTSLLSLTAVVTTSFGIIVFIFRNPLSNWLSLPAELILLMVFEILFIPPVKFWMVKQRFLYKYVSVVLVTLCMLVVNNALGIILVLNSDTKQAVWRVFSIAIVQAVAGLCFYICFFCKSGFRNLSSYWKYGTKLNLPLIPHGLSIVVLSSSDRIMINSLVGSIQAGIYGVAYSVGLIINSIKLSLVDALKPWVYEKLGKKQFAEIEKVCRIVFLLNILMTYIIVGLAPEIVRVLAAPEYYEAIYVIPPVAASSYFTFIYNICSIVELYYEKNKKIMIASISAAAINIVLNYVFIPIYGYVAAGYTTLISYIVLSMLHFVFLNMLRKKEMQGVSIINLKNTILLSIVVIGGMVLFSFLYSNTLLRLLVVLLVAVICFVERNRFVHTLKALKKRK